MSNNKSDHKQKLLLVLIDFFRAPFSCEHTASVLNTATYVITCKCTYTLGGWFRWLLCFAGIRMLCEDLGFRDQVDAFIRTNVHKVISSKRFFGLPELRVEMIGEENYRWLKFTNIYWSSSNKSYANAFIICFSSSFNCFGKEEADFDSTSSQHCTRQARIARVAISLVLNTL